MSRPKQGWSLFTVRRTTVTPSSLVLHFMVSPYGNAPKEHWDRDMALPLTLDDAEDWARRILMCVEEGRAMQRPITQVEE